METPTGCKNSGHPEKDRIKVKGLNFDLTTAAALKSKLRELNEKWIPASIQKVIRFKTRSNGYLASAKAKAFKNRALVIGDMFGWNPMITLDGSKVTILIFTYTNGCLTYNDFLLAQLIDELFNKTEMSVENVKGVLSEWTVITSGKDQSIYRKFGFQTNRRLAKEFKKSLGRISSNLGWGENAVTLVTETIGDKQFHAVKIQSTTWMKHGIKGVTRNDFAFALKATSAYHGIFAPGRVTHTTYKEL